MTDITRRGFIGSAAAAAAAGSNVMADKKRNAAIAAPPEPVKPRKDMPATVIVDASDFIDLIARDQRFVNSYILGGERLYNNTALKIEAMTDFFTQVEIPERGYYNLYVRSKGNKSFKVAIGDNYLKEFFGDTEEMKFEKGGRFRLEAGKCRISLTRAGGNRGNLPDTVFDSLVLTKDEMSEEKLFAHQLPAEVELLREFDVAGNTVKFGDVTGDGSADVMALEGDWSFTVYDNRGNKLWRYQAPEKGADLRTAEPPGLIWDINRDGKGEVLHWRWIDGADHLAIAEGETGKILKTIPWPMPYTPPHRYAGFRITVAKLHKSDYPNDIIVMSDPGYSGDGRSPERIKQGHPVTQSVVAYNSSLKELWRYEVARARNHLGHYAYPRDLNADGLDEIVWGHVVLDSKGREIWSQLDKFYHNYDHCDSIRFADIDEDGREEILSPTSDVGVMARDALTGEILWMNTSEHGQQLEVGDFLNFVEPPHIAVTARYYGGKGRKGALSSQIQWFDRHGNRLMVWPANPIEGNLDAVKGDWYGDGGEVLFWDRFRINSNGRGELYFPGTVYHMFDFTGDGADEVITKIKIAKGDWKIQVYGSKKANRRKGYKHTPAYLKDKMANHTHY